ncbi:MAG: pyridoxine 5'-phosphate synthase [Candidatus Omnitrophica bacterium]|nr:pyridoxine 5'-phosphate synthase [Candidatus Omnitrophota bacterium]
MVKLGINVDHVATVREARRTIEPDPVEAALLCEKAGCDSIVAHLRVDRRHINDDDLCRLRKRVKTRLNLEMSIDDEIVAIACDIKPDQATLVPEKRQEITTEGGLDVVGGSKDIKKAIDRLKEQGIEVSLFIDPAKDQIEESKRIGADIIELHTGAYANSSSDGETNRHLKELSEATRLAKSIGLKVAAGHGLTYKNTKPVRDIEGIEELNIGHSIISRSVFVGIGTAVKEMVELMR